MRRKRTYPPGCHFTAVWEFRVPGDKRRAFEKAYGPNGDWARLFRESEGYLGTELVRNREISGGYATLDFWTSRLAFKKFKKQNAAAYKSLDKKCSSLTLSEKLIGEFEKAIPPTLLWRASNAMSDAIVRPATAADIPAMIALEQAAASAAHWSKDAYGKIFVTDSPKRVALVSESRNELPNGFVVARLDDDDCELENIAVGKGARRQGIAFGLLQALRTLARNSGAQRMLLEVRESNTAARALYEKCGFEISSRRKAYYRNPEEDAVIYSLRL